MTPLDSPELHGNVRIPPCRGSINNKRLLGVGQVLTELLRVGVQNWPEWPWLAVAVIAIGRDWPVERTCNAWRGPIAGRL